MVKSMQEVVFNITEKGYSHDKTGMPCQDYSFVEQNENHTILVVADGHGGDDYFRSDVGSFFATYAIVETFKELEKEIDEGLDAILENKIKISLLKKWNKLVEEDVNKSPFSESELEKFNDTKKLLLKENFYRAYGTTINAVLVLKNKLLAVNLGDGNVVTINSKWEVVDLFSNYDEEDVANVTNSLCQENAYENIHIKGTEDDFMIISVCSDGVINPYGSLNNYEKNILWDFYKKIFYGDGSVEKCKNFISILGREKGTGDDVSFACLMRKVQ